MARLYYECNVVLKNSTEDGETIKPYACTPDKYCLYCCCNSQCCLLVQRRPPRHFWEAWYFWLGIALLAVFIISSVSSYIVSNCRHNIQGVPLRHSTHDNRRNDHGNPPGSNQNEISISIIPTSEFFPSHRKMFVVASQPAVNHLSAFLLGPLFMIGLNYLNNIFIFSFTNFLRTNTSLQGSRKLDETNCTLCNFRR